MVWFPVGSIFFCAERIPLNDYVFVVWFPVRNIFCCAKRVPLDDCVFGCCVDGCVSGLTELTELLMIVCLAVVIVRCVSGLTELTELLLKSGADLTVLTANGDTVMHAAVYGNNLHITNMLIKAGGFFTLM